MPVLLSGAGWFQSTESRVSIVRGLFGATSSASEFVRPDGESSGPMSNVYWAKAPITVCWVATSVPFTHTSA
jgi:hypothetical protein